MTTDGNIGIDSRLAKRLDVRDGIRISCCAMLTTVTVNQPSILVCVLDPPYRSEL